jgi:hypothetical protein
LSRQNRPRLPGPPQRAALAALHEPRSIRSTSRRSQCNRPNGLGWRSLTQPHTWALPLSITCVQASHERHAENGGGRRPRRLARGHVTFSPVLTSIKIPPASRSAAAGATCSSSLLSRICVRLSPAGVEVICYDPPATVSLSARLPSGKPRRSLPEALLLDTLVFRVCTLLAILPLVPYTAASHVPSRSVIASKAVAFTAHSTIRFGTPSSTVPRPTMNP